MKDVKNLKNGEILDERYVVKNMIAKGGMGTTYLSYDKKQSIDVVIKALTFSELKDWKVYELFEREIQTLQGINHPNIPEYIDSFKIEQPDDTFFICVQEYVDGDNFEQAIEKGRRFSVNEVEKIFKSLLKTLDYIHNIQPPVIHRDINPRNIIIDKNNKVYLVDFNASGRIAKSTMAAGGTFVGTFGYMAQEQLYGKAYPATDLYALAMTIIYLLTGLEPSKFPLNDMKVDYHSYVNIPGYFKDLLDKMIEPDVNKRIQSAEECLSILNNKRMNWKSRENEPVKKKKKSVELKILISVILFISIAGAFVFIFITSRGGEKPITKPIKATDKEASSGLSTYTVPKIDPARITEYKDTSINVIAVSNDNKLVAVGGTADVILIWNIETGKLQHKLVGHRREILKLSFSPDNEKLLSFAEDKKLILWDLKTGKPVKSFVLKRVYNAPVAFSPDFKQFCYLGYRYFLNIYRIKDGSKIASFKVPGYYSGSIKYSTDGKYIAFRLRDSKQYRIAVINVSEYSHKLLRYIALEYDTDIKFSKTNTFLYAISDDNNVVKYNYKNNTFMERILNKNAKYTIKAFDIHEKKGLIAYTQFNNVIIADLKSGRNIRIFKQPGYTYTKAVKFSRDGNYVYIAKKNYVVGVINLKNKKIQYYSPPQS